MPILFTFVQFFSFDTYFTRIAVVPYNFLTMLAAVRHGLPGPRESPCETLSLLHFFPDFTGIFTAWKFYGKTMSILISG